MTRSKDEISPRMRTRLEKARKEARERVVQRGIMQFRVDAEIMDLILQVSEYKRIPAGTLCRAWVVEKLRQEVADMSAKEDR